MITYEHDLVSCEVWVDPQPSSTPISLYAATFESTIHNSKGKEMSRCKDSEFIFVQWPLQCGFLGLVSIAPSFIYKTKCCATAGICLTSTDCCYKNLLQISYLQKIRYCDHTSLKCLLTH